MKKVERINIIMRLHQQPRYQFLKDDIFALHEVRDDYFAVILPRCL